MIPIVNYEKSVVYYLYSFIDRKLIGVVEAKRVGEGQNITINQRGVNIRFLYQNAFYIKAKSNGVFNFARFHQLLSPGELL